MFNSRDTLFGKKDEIAPKDFKASGLPGAPGSPVSLQHAPPASVRAESAPPPRAVRGNTGHRLGNFRRAIRQQADSRA